MTARGTRLGALFIPILLALTACAAPPPPPRTSGAQPAPEERRIKTIVYAVTSYVDGIGLTAGSTTSGGWATANELHSNGLITSDSSGDARSVPAVRHSFLYVADLGSHRAQAAPDLQ